MSAWHYIRDGQSVGPTNEQQLRNLVSVGGITPTTQVWREGMTDWVEAQATELRSLFGPTVAPPHGAVPPSVTARSERSGFKNPSTLAAWIKWLMIAGIAIAVISLGLGLVEFSNLQKGVVTSEDELSPLELVQALVGLGHLVLYVGTAVVFLCWVHRANSNARALGASGMTFTPGWSVGWYFVPIANLWKPYHAMKEIWKASKSPTDWVNEPDPPLLAWWWTLWIISNLLGQASFRTSMHASASYEQQTLANVVSLASDAIDVPLTIVAIMLVRSITAMQVSHASQPD